MKMTKAGQGVRNVHDVNRVGSARRRLELRSKEVKSEPPGYLGRTFQTGSKCQGPRENMVGKEGHWL